MNKVNKENNIFGCFVSGPSLMWDATVEDEKQAEEKGKLFREYIWGENGIDSVLKEVVNVEYGIDVRLILFQFYINPLKYELESLDKTEGYRQREKSIGFNIIITDLNFFNKNHEERLCFLKTSILKSLEIMNEIYSDRVDTRFDLLFRELQKRFKSISDLT